MRASTNPELTAAWATVPDVAKAQERHQEAVKLRRDFSRGAAPAEALTALQGEVIATFTATGKWPADYAKRAAKAHAEAVVWEAEAVALRRLEDVTKAEAENIRDSLSADVLRHLRGRLTEILDAAKSAGEALGDATSAEQAIEAGGDALDAWRRLTALLRDYANVRAASWDVLQSVSGMGPRLRQWRDAGHGQIRGVRLDNVPAHIVDVMRSGAFTIEYLVWLARSGAAFIAESYDDLEANAMAATEPVTYDDRGPLRDLSPTVKAAPEPMPSQIFPHSLAPSLGVLEAAPKQPTVTANPGDPTPYTPSF
ncbi:hypothetical protein OG806_09770 [Streptomyces sp. NBC_00882]|uniref:hypothetical protein n=1 Tax=Streptomyces sp. NBC_00882 TaxID=2975856 RepID=UPI00386843E1|nr:hypothetical protein OG806_09770 [Streptomyces sp. NBC_00882]